MPRRRDPHEIKALAESIRSEIRGDAVEMADLLAGEVLADTREVNRPRWLDWIARNWVSVPGFSFALVDRMAPRGVTGQRPEEGLEQYRRDVFEAFGATPPPRGTPSPYFALAAQALQMPAPNPMMAQPASTASATAVAVPPVPPVQPGGI